MSVVDVKWPVLNPNGPHEGHALKINGVYFSPEILESLTTESENWQGPFWIRRLPHRNVVEFTTQAPENP